ncbi:hypothetical protein Dimus_039318 [Dionaea muscipula]
MLRGWVMDFGGSWEEHIPLMEFAYNNSHQSSIDMVPFEALYGRRCRSPTCWFEVGEAAILEPDMVQMTTEKIKQIQKRLVTAQSRQKSYADLARRNVQFEVGDKVFLRVSPLRGVIRFGKRGNLNPRYIGPYKILDRVDDVAYRLALPPDLSEVHNVFHVSLLRKYVSDLRHVLTYVPMDIDRDLSYEEQPVRIMDFKEKTLRSKTIPLVNVLWRNQTVEEATWEPEEEIRQKYPHLFAD